MIKLLSSNFDLQSNCRSWRLVLSWCLCVVCSRNKWCSVWCGLDKMSRNSLPWTCQSSSAARWVWPVARSVVQTTTPPAELEPTTSRRCRRLQLPACCPTDPAVIHSSQNQWLQRRVTTAELRVTCYRIVLYDTIEEFNVHSKDGCVASLI